MIIGYNIYDTQGNFYGRTLTMEEGESLTAGNPAPSSEQPNKEGEDRFAANWWGGAPYYMAIAIRTPKSMPQRLASIRFIVD